MPENLRVGMRVTRTPFNKESTMNNMNKLSACVFAVATSLAGIAAAQETFKVPIHRIDSKGQREVIGEVNITPVTTGGLMFSAALKNIPTGDHGFHVHQNGSCAPGDKDGKVIAGGAAGPHLDPHDSKAHGDTKTHGHLGDLPSLRADTDGNVAQSVMAPRLALADVRGRAIVIHAGGDNHKDTPKADGGGGDRIACGVIR
jgi:superoxide dismutase, Cu-Zn family